MKNFSLRTLIPLAAASALVMIGCGGKATDGVVGDGDADGDQQNMRPGDPLSDTSFNRSLDAAVDDYCDKAHDCGQFDSHRECILLFGEVLKHGYDTESSRCRGLILEALDCNNEALSDCSEYNEDCSELGSALNEECALYDDYEN